jgi:hypothetical protein
MARQRTTRPCRLLRTLALELALIAGVGIGVPALAHEWLSGQRDPLTGVGCCNDKDCHPQPFGAVEPVKGGWLIRATGEVWPEGRQLWSQDGRYWVCIWGGKTRCLFVPPMGA